MLNKSFEKPISIRFGHCDPAGIIFYPRFFEILNGLVEDWFGSDLGCDFATLLNDFGLGTPMVNLHTEFIAPCRLGDIVDFSLHISDLGNSSATIEVNGRVKSETYIQAQGVLVCSKINLSGSQPWPQAIKEKMELYLPPT